MYQLTENSYVFPPPELARADGFLAAGGDLSAGRLLNAYANGIFPWYAPGDVIQWWCPHERFVIFPEDVNVSRSMKKFARRTAWEVTFNEDFAGVMHNCRMLRENETWIGDDMEAAYRRLFELGYAMSAEVRNGPELVGGLYGVVIGKCFFGESMFSKAANASKLALIRLCEKLAAAGFVFIDCQFHTEHLERMGGWYISWEDYKRLLRKGLPRGQ